jgi:uncharacterized protein (TIGR04222 family)
MTPSQQLLWERVRAFVFDDPQSPLTFTQRLARENGWSVGFADRVVDEYRRFVFLAVASGQEVTPSDEVDQAWHMHLTYSRSYWRELCGKILGTPLHHGPTRGTPSDADRHRQQYVGTLAMYEQTFGNPPPSDVWPSVEERFSDSRRHVRVDRHQVWIVPKPWKLFRLSRLKSTRNLVLSIAPLFLAVTLNPLDMKGPEFLGFYAILMTVTVLGALLLRYVLRPGENAATEPLDPYQVACLAGGVEGAIQAAAASLVHRGAIEVGPLSDLGNSSRDIRLSVRHGSPEDANELEQRIVAACDNSYGSRFGYVCSYAKPAAEKIQHRLEAWGLLVPSDGIQACRWVPALLMLVTVGLGIAKIIVGVQRNRPVNILVIMVISFAFAAFCFFKRPHRTHAGSALLKTLKSENSKLREKRYLPEHLLGPEQIALTAALFGLPTIATGEMLLLPDAWKFRNGPPLTGSSGCSGGSCGGGGCGGGGCGGCGGD